VRTPSISCDVSLGSGRSVLERLGFAAACQPQKPINVVAMNEDATDMELHKIHRTTEPPVHAQGLEARKCLLLPVEGENLLVLSSRSRCYAKH